MPHNHVVAVSNTSATAAQEIAAAQQASTYAAYVSHGICWGRCAAAATAAPAVVCSSSMPTSHFQHDCACLRIIRSTCCCSAGLHSVLTTVSAAAAVDTSSGEANWCRRIAGNCLASDVISWQLCVCCSSWAVAANRAATARAATACQHLVSAYRTHCRRKQAQTGTSYNCMQLLLLLE
jgi:hypothetical protein